ncbi:MAG: RHS repeat-associated core domain-containing protein [Candidatus Korobacteraceae bacterium]
MGRWLTPDPGGLAVVNPFNPQSWNRYSYVNNNPLNAVDPWGLDPCVNGRNPQTGNICTNVERPFDPQCEYWFNCFPRRAGGGSSTPHEPDDEIEDEPGERVPTSSPGAEQPCPVNFSDRLGMLGSGLLNLTVGGVKLSGAAAIGIGTSGIGTVLAAYGAYSAAGNISTGSLLIIGAFMPNGAHAAQLRAGASVSSAAGSIAGLTTFAVTRGNLNAAAHAARFEGIMLFGFRGGATGSSPTLPQAASAGATVTAQLTSGGCN